MLEERGILYTYRDYRSDPLDVSELHRIFRLLDLSPRQALRRHDKAFRELGLTGDESDRILIEHMALHPTLIQRPIGVSPHRAVLGRPPEKLLELEAESRR